jgi:hypothetical protein
MPAFSSRLVFRASRASLTASVAMALTGACTGMEANAMETLFDSWKAAPIEQAKEQWGPPLKVQAVAGGTAYVWQDEIPMARPPGTGPHDVRPGAEPPPAFGHCQRKLIAGPDGKVIGGEWQGDACCVTTRIGKCAALINKLRPKAG